MLDKCMSIDLWHGDFSCVFTRENETTFKVVINATIVPLQKSSKKEKVFVGWRSWNMIHPQTP